MKVKQEAGEGCVSAIRLCKCARGNSEAGVYFSPFNLISAFLFLLQCLLWNTTISVAGERCSCVRGSKAKISPASESQRRYFKVGGKRLSVPGSDSSSCELVKVLNWSGLRDGLQPLAVPI